MDEMIGYIFSNLKTSEYSVKNITKVLESQKRFNQRVVTFAFLAAVYAVLANINAQEQNKKIEKLSSEIKKLKRSEGE